MIGTVCPERQVLMGRAWIAADIIASVQLAERRLAAWAEPDGALKA